MPRFIDLSHTFENGMPGFRLKNEDGTVTQFTATIRPFITHQQSRPRYQGLAEFEITEMQFHTSIGTYLDSPYHRWKERRDIARLGLDEVILPGVLIDARRYAPFEAAGIEVLPRGVDLAGRAVLFHFGWDQQWGSEAYFQYPFIGRALIDHLANAQVRLVGVDTINIDDARDPERPAHSILLKQDILIVENLAHLDELYGNQFRFFAVPLKAKGAAAMPVRAFAETV